MSYHLQHKGMKSALMSMTLHTVGSAALSPVCTISPSCFLAKCRKKRLKHGTVFFGLSRDLFSVQTGRLTNTPVQIKCRQIHQTASSASYL